MPYPFGHEGGEEIKRDARGRTPDPTRLPSAGPGADPGPLASAFNHGPWRRESAGKGAGRRNAVGALRTPYILSVAPELRLG